MEPEPTDLDPTPRTIPPKKPRRRFGRAVAIVAGVLVLVVVGFLYGTGAGKDVRNLWTNGVLQPLLFHDPDRAYQAGKEQNLKAIRTALMLYEDSEGQFPQAAGWMDAIQNRIGASDMQGSESAKKLVRPDLAGHPGEFGYALNDKASGKYKGDVGAKTILIYESKQTARNAHGDPSTDRTGLAMAVDGTILK